MRDPVYGFIGIPKDFLPVVDHELCQRLRWIGQLPLEQLVYPSAMHSRFEHSLGCMYLAMYSAAVLIKNKCVLEAVTAEFEECPKETFILAAGLVGLLHDIGHAPFSHTLEEVKTYLGLSKFYDHEEVGYSVAKIILKQFSGTYKSTVLIVLNKNIKTFQSPIQKILRQLVDNYFDVDKGDYLLRDSYHCGVVYGIYDYRRLWGNITVTRSFDIALTEKSALEAWTLLLARYRMYEAVYKHHVRDFSDALLVKIIGIAYEANKDILPVNENYELTEKKDDFLLWTDDHLIRSLFDNANIRGLVLQFKKRELYKRCGDDIQLNDYGIGKNSLVELAKQLKEVEKKNEENQINTCFIFYKQNIVPLKTESVTKLNVITKGQEISLSKFLKFDFDGSTVHAIDEQQEVNPQDDEFADKKFIEPRILRIFIDKPNLEFSEEIMKEYCKVLESYKQALP